MDPRVSSSRKTWIRAFCESKNMEGEKWKVEGGRWKAEGGRWKMDDGWRKWKVEGGR